MQPQVAARRRSTSTLCAAEVAEYAPRRGPFGANPSFENALDDQAVTYDGLTMIGPRNTMTYEKASIMPPYYIRGVATILTIPWRLTIDLRFFPSYVGRAFGGWWGPLSAPPPHERPGHLPQTDQKRNQGNYRW